MSHPVLDSSLSPCRTLFPCDLFTAAPFVLYLLAAQWH